MVKSSMKKMVSMLLAVSMLASVSVSAAAASSSNFKKVNDYTPGQFTDVPADSWCAENVQVAYEYGLMGGKSSTTFDPNGSLTVAQTIVMASRLHNIYNGSKVEFASGESPWYAPQLRYAQENGILTKDFSAYDVPIKRADFAVILGAALPEKELKAVNSVEDKSIPDVPEDASYAAAVYRLYRAGVLTGNDAKGTFAPESNITRGAAAAIIGRMADPTLRKSITLKQPPFQAVPVDQLANKKSLQKKCTDEEFQQAYDAAVELVTPVGKSSREEQLMHIAVELRRMFESGMSYSTDTPHYNDPYGYFILGTASCAGCARTTGLCLSVLGIPYEHVNENQWSHQWCRVKMDDGSYWICDAYGLYCGPEPAPYQHPYL